MITAQNKQTGIDAGLDPASAPGGFGKVLNSIQGLQQRLGDFSVEVIASAEANAITLIRRLVQLQSQLNKLADLKRALAETDAVIRQIPEPNYDLIGLDSLEKHPQLHAIVNASKLIRLHRLLKVARASAEAVSFDADLGRLDINSPLAPAIAPGRKEKYPERAAKSQAEPETAKSKTARTKGREAQAPVIELPSLPPLSDTSGQADAKSGASESAAPVAPVSATSERPAATIELAELPSPSQTAALNSEPQHPAETVYEARSPENRGGAHETRPDLEPARPVQQPAEPKAEPAAEVPPSLDSAATAKTAPQFDDERVGSVIDALFDQRLLDELIQNYGEIIPSAKTSEPLERQPSVPRVEAEPQAARVAAPRQEVPDSREKLSTPVADPLLPPEPNFVAAEPAPAAQTATVESIEAQVPSVRANKDLDRQLKKIIKDYGEYDLYSQQSSLSLKKSGIAAFIVLGLVLGAVYFLRSPAQTAPAPTPAAVSSGQESAPAAPPATEERKDSSDESKQRTGSERATKAARTESKQIP